MRLRSATLLAATLALGWALPAAAQVHMCVDKDGKKSYQQGPCPALVVNSGVQPLKLEKLTEADVRKTVAMMNKADAERDTAAFVRFLSPDFTSTVVSNLDNSRGKTLKAGHDQFAANLAKTHRLMSHYEEVASNQHVAVQGDQGTYKAHIRGKTVLANSVIDTDVDQETTFAIENGQLLVRGIVETLNSESVTPVAAGK